VIMSQSNPKKTNIFISLLLMNIWCWYFTVQYLETNWSFIWPIKVLL